MKESNRFSAWRIWVAAISILLVGSGMSLAFYTHADRENVLDQADKDILYDASLAASSLDAILRICSLDLSHIVSGGETMQENIDDIAFNLPETSNIYLLDDTGTLLFSAYKRFDNSLSMDPAIMMRMRSGAAMDYRIIDVAQEGGKVLAFLYRVDIDGEPPNFAVALLSAYTLQRGVSTLLSRSYAGMHVSDPHGGSLALIQSAVSTRKAVLSASVSLANFPLAVTVVADKYDILLTWRTRTIVLSAVTFGLCVTIGTLLHELLYSHPMDAGNDVGSYLQSLTDAVAEAFDLGVRIRLEEHHEGGLRCTMDRMVPLALIVNELLTNVFK